MSRAIIYRFRCDRCGAIHDSFAPVLPWGWHLAGTEQRHWCPNCPLTSQAASLTVVTNAKPKRKSIKTTLEKGH